MLDFFDLLKYIIKQVGLISYMFLDEVVGKWTLERLLRGLDALPFIKDYDPLRDVILNFAVFMNNYDNRCYLLTAINCK